jgi:hypothetical protein
MFSVSLQVASQASHYKIKKHKTMRNKSNSVKPWREYEKGKEYQQMMNEYTPNFNIKIISFKEIPQELHKAYLDRGFSPATSRDSHDIWGEIVSKVKLPKYTSGSFDSIDYPFIDPQKC